MTKRKRNALGGMHDGVLDSATSSSASAKRGRPNPKDQGSAAGTSVHSVSYGRVDPTYGQRSAIPGLDYEEEEEGEEGECGDGNGEEGGEDGDEEDKVEKEALRYLRSVREEASGIPTLLVAPRSTTASGRNAGSGYADEDEDGDEVDRGIYDDGVGDSRGWYRDGAYTAAPTSPLSASATADTGNDGGRDPQKVYYEALLARFEMLRQQLAQVPPRHAVERLGPDHGSYMSGSAKDYRTWRWRVAHMEPMAAQVAGMDKGSVLRVLRMMGGWKGGCLDVQSLVGEKGGKARRRRVSAWLWALLAKLPGRGELVSEEVGVVRELGKRAVWVGVEMKGVDMSSVEDQMGKDGEEENESEEESVDYEQVFDVEVNEEDEEQDFEGNPEASAVLTIGDYQTRRRSQSIFDRRNPMSAENSESIPGIGPAMPEDLPQPPSESAEDNEAQALSQARSRLLARVQEGDEEQKGDGNEARGGEGGKKSNETKEEEQEKEEEETEDRQSAIHATNVLLDMIITIAGEAYGQRDLLEFREGWE